MPCGVTTNDRAYCWGLGDYGQLGYGTLEEPETCNTNPCSTRPVAVLGGLRFRSVSAGDRHSCGVTTENRAYCWGRGSEGQLGDGNPSGSPTPVAVAGTRRFREVRVGGEHTCAITTTDLALCWGTNSRGELGDGTASNRATPVRVLSGLVWRQLSAGASHNCGVTTTGRVYCWGQNSTGFAFSCGVTTSSRAYCWGDNYYGELGDGSGETRAYSLVPIAVAAPT